MNSSCYNKVKKRMFKTINDFGITTIPSVILTKNKINQRIFADSFKNSLILN
jgi:hypothetical protein